MTLIINAFQSRTEGTGVDLRFSSSPHESGSQIPGSPFLSHFVAPLSQRIFGDAQKCVYLHADKMDMESIDTANMCSHLQRKLFEKEGVYHPIWAAVLEDPELTAVVRSRQLHIYRNGKKVLVLAGKAAPKVIREDTICAFLPKV